MRAGITTWAAMAYIISVNASIIADSGGPCVCNDPVDPACMSNVEYDLCLNEVRQELIISTAAISALASFLMGFFANLPIGMAPGLGINAYFAYSIVGFHGTGRVSYAEALGAVFLEGWIFLFLSLIGLRQWLVRLMPQSLVLSVGAGIGLFIAFIGLARSGLGVIGGSTSTYLTIGGCRAEDWIDGMPGYCARNALQSPTMWLGIFMGGVFTVLMMMYRVRGAILIGILATSIISWPRGTPVTFFPYNTEGDQLFNYFKQVVTFKPLSRVANALSFNYGNGQVWYALVTFLYVDILDTTGTVYSMAKFANLRDPITLDFERSTVAYCVDAFSISIGALLGVSPVTAFIESATGISEGGKTGLTAIFTAIMFLVSVFFSPIFASIPGWATGGALVIVGSLMISNVREVNWAYIGDAVPAFITIIMIPLTYNIAYGVIAGIGTYLVLNVIPWTLKKLSGGRIVPPNYDASEEWVVPPGGMMPYWMRKVLGRPTQREETLAMEHPSMNGSHQHVSMDTIEQQDNIMKTPSINLELEKPITKSRSPHY